MPRASAISLRVTTAESGKPLAMGLPVVTMSGHTPASPAPPATLSTSTRHQACLQGRTLRLEGPEVGADPAEARLHLIGHAQPAHAPHGLVRRLQVLLRQRHLHHQDRAGFRDHQSRMSVCVLGAWSALHGAGPVEGGCVCPACLAPTCPPHAMTPSAKKAAMVRPWPTAVDTALLPTTTPKAPIPSRVSRASLANGSVQRCPPRPCHCLLPARLTHLTLSPYFWPASGPVWMPR